MKGKLKRNFTKICDKLFERGTNTKPGLMRAGSLKFHLEIEIDAPTETVWAFITDIDLINQWSTTNISVDSEENRSPAVGQQCQLNVEHEGRVVSSNLEIKKCVEAEHLELQLTGNNATSTLIFELVPVDSRTTLHHTSTKTSSSALVNFFYQFASPIVSRIGRRNTANELMNLKRVAEAPLGSKKSS